MKIYTTLLAFSLILIACNKNEATSTASKPKDIKKVEGAWKMVYG